MQRDQKRVEQALKKKGFQEVFTDHRYYYYCTLAGHDVAIHTYTSHGNKDLNDYLISRMAKQCFLTKQEFLKFVDCKMSQIQYEEILKNKGILKVVL